MPNNKNKIYLYEALELRSEYDARIKNLKDLLPEAKENRDKFYFRRDDEVKLRPASGFSVDEVRDELNIIEFKKRKLNNTIQQVNFNHHIVINDQEINLAEALELRKSVNVQIGELSAQLVSSAYERVIYKEGRDIVESPNIEFSKTMNALENKRLLFRDLNRKLRAISYSISIDFIDEK
ncbi:hypothetical protein HY745_01405 [Candidatus Desantisbacteria bacterium]|nr:hypothetical protein [Candidatus Desantisbacteria bacterium]